MTGANFSPGGRGSGRKKGGGRQGHVRGTGRKEEEQTCVGREGGDDVPRSVGDDDFDNQSVCLSCFSRRSAGQVAVVRLHRLLHRPLAHSRDTLLLIHPPSYGTPSCRRRRERGGRERERERETEGDAEKGLIVI